MTMTQATNRRRKASIAPIAIDLFAGCGGLTLGLKQAGFEVLAAVEIDHNAATTYAANHPTVCLKEIDIRKVKPKALMLELGLQRGQLDLLAGCPPCQGFSSLRTRNGANRNRDVRNDLVRQMLRFARTFHPKTIMMENVPKLVRHKPFKLLLDGLKRLGYKVDFAIKDAARYGVPQRRKRLILLASRCERIRFASEARTRVTVRDAIATLPSPQAGHDRLHSLGERRSTKVQRLIRDIPKDGGSRSDLPKSRQLECHKKSDGFKDIYGRMAWDDVAPTITSGCFNPSKGRFLHPARNRVITMREAAVLQSFPRRYKFDVSMGKTSIALMIGNALPPEFIRRHAVEIRTAIGK